MNSTKLTIFVLVAVSLIAVSKSAPVKDSTPDSTDQEVKAKEQKDIQDNIARGIFGKMDVEQFLTNRDYVKKLSEDLQRLVELFPGRSKESKTR